MPNNLDAEQALLGCMLIDNEILPEVLDALTDNDFYQDSHKFIISAIKLTFAEIGRASCRERVLPRV